MGGLVIGFELFDVIIMGGLVIYVREQVFMEGLIGIVTLLIHGS